MFEFLLISRFSRVPACIRRLMFENAVSRIVKLDFLTGPSGLRPPTRAASTPRHALKLLLIRVTDLVVDGVLANAAVGIGAVVEEVRVVSVVLGVEATDTGVARGGKSAATRSDSDAEVVAGIGKWLRWG